MLGTGRGGVITVKKIKYIQGPVVEVAVHVGMSTWIIRILECGGRISDGSKDKISTYLQLGRLGHLISYAAE